jgi:hypothetical protein
MTTTTSVGTVTATGTAKSTRAVWFLASLQFAYVSWFGVCVWVALARAAHFAGHLYIPHQGDQYTATADVWTGWSSGFIGPMAATATLQPFIVLASIGVSAWLLVQKRTRSHPILFSVLLVSALLVLATFVLAALPAGRSISGWILD